MKGYEGGRVLEVQKPDHGGARDPISFFLLPATLQHAPHRVGMSKRMLPRQTYEW